jgi:hypothetical protein
MNTADVPFFIRCDGLGLRLGEENDFRPTPMVSIFKYLTGPADSANPLRLNQ